MKKQSILKPLLPLSPNFDRRPIGGCPRVCGSHCNGYLRRRFRVSSQQQQLHLQAKPFLNLPDCVELSQEIFTKRHNGPGWPLNRPIATTIPTNAPARCNSPTQPLRSVVERATCCVRSNLLRTVTFVVNVAIHRRRPEHCKRVRAK